MPQPEAISQGYVDQYPGGGVQAFRDSDLQHITFSVPAAVIEIIKRGYPFNDVETAVENARVAPPNPLAVGSETGDNRVELTLTLPQALVIKLRTQEDPGQYFAAAMQAYETSIRAERDEAMEASIRAMEGETSARRRGVKFAPEEFPF
jgi:hypothetical protein